MHRLKVFIRFQTRLIAVVINMFRLPDFLTGENVMCNSLKLLQTWQPLYYCFYWKKSKLLRNNVPYLNTWHRRKATHWHHWQPKYLPPYSPDLNPIERIWLTIKARWFNNYVCKTEEKLLERLDQAILDVIDNPKKAQKTARIGTLIWQTLCRSWNTISIPIE